jgi:ankyrin repeat protein
MSFFYNDLLFEIYHYIPKYDIPLLNKSCKRMQVIDKRIKRYVNHKKYDHINEGLYDGCKTGDIKLVKLMIKKGANNWNWGLASACKSNNMKIVKLMIKKGANDWIWGLEYACQGGHMKIVKLMIKKGADYRKGNRRLTTFDSRTHEQLKLLNWGLYCACYYGHIRLVKFMIKKSADDLDWGLNRACSNEHIRIVKFLIKKGASVSQCYCKKTTQEHLALSP